MIITNEAVTKRLNQGSSNNKDTKTFFRFSVGSQTFYYGHAIDCAFGTTKCKILSLGVTKMEHVLYIKQNATKE